MKIPPSITYPFPTADYQEVMKKAIDHSLGLTVDQFGSIHEAQWVGSLLQTIQKRLFSPKIRIKLAYHELSLVVLALRKYLMSYDCLAASILLMDLEPYLGSSCLFKTKKDHAVNMVFLMPDTIVKH